MIINPNINENNFLEQIGLKNNESFIPGFIEFGNNNKETWRRIGEAMGYNPYIKYNGAEIKSILPNYIEAQNLFIKHNLKKLFRNTIQKGSQKFY